MLLFIVSILLLKIENRMDMDNILTIMVPTLRISHEVLRHLVSDSKFFFPENAHRLTDVPVQRQSFLRRLFSRVSVANEKKKIFFS
jgi:hypothetical protein